MSTFPKLETKTATDVLPSDSALFTAVGDQPTPQAEELMQVAKVLPSDSESRGRLARLIQDRTQNNRLLGGIAWHEFILPYDVDVSAVDTNPKAPKNDTAYFRLLADMMGSQKLISPELLQQLTNSNGGPDRDLA